MSVGLLDRKTPLVPVGGSEDGLGQYMKEVRKYPRLTPQQERQLAMACAAGDEEAIQNMVSSNLRLVVSIAREYAGRGVPLQDLIQEGSIGLLVAAKKFDYRLEYRFSTYASKWIRQGVTRCILNHAGLIRVPVHTAERMRKVLQAKAAIQQEEGHMPTSNEIAEYTGIPAEKVDSLMALLPEICSLDAPAGGEEDSTLQLLIEDVQAPEPQEELAKRELKHTVDSLLGQLSDRQQQILRMHYGMTDGVCRSLEEIGKTLGISKERARQIEHQAMDKLLKLGADSGLEDFLE